MRITPDILVAGEKGGLLDILLAQLVKKGATVPKTDVLALTGALGQGAAAAETGALPASGAGKKGAA